MPTYDEICNSKAKMSENNDSSDYSFETPPLSPLVSEVNASERSQPECTVEEEVTDKFSVEIEDVVIQFQDEERIRHNQCPDSDDESEYEPLEPVTRNHRIVRRGDGKLFLKKTFSSGVGFKESVLDYALSTRYNIKQYIGFKESVLVLGLLGSDFSTSWEGVQELLSGNVLHGTSLFLVRYAFQTTLHTLWIERNKRRHGEAPHSLNSLLKYVDRIVRNRLAILSQEARKYEDGLRMWFGSRQP